MSCLRSKLLLCSLAFGSAGGAQSLIELPAPTAVVNTIDMDLVGSAGSTDLAAIVAAAQPRPAGIRALRFAANAGAPLGRYDSGAAHGRALALHPSGAGLALIDPPAGAYAAADLSLELAGLSSEIGFGIGDFGGPLLLDFFASGVLVLSTSTSSYAAPGPKFFRMSGARFDRVDVRVPLGGNFVLTDLAIQELEGLFPAFTAAPRTGVSPLLVQFQDASFSSHPAGIRTWEWDFENDGIVDATTADPSFAYAACGSYDVALTVTDAQHGSARRLEVEFVVVDPLTVDFDATPRQGCAPLVVQFTDLTQGGASAWEWDFENDGIVDSTRQHPVHTFAQADALHDVRLVVRNACRPQGVARTKMGFLRTIGALQTLFEANSGGSVGGAVYFDLDVRAPLEISGFETSYDAPVGTPVGLSIFLTAAGASAFGSETQPSAWTFLAQDDGSARAAGVDRPTRIGIVPRFALAPARYGVALVARGDGHRYSAISGPLASYGDALLEIMTGSATNAPFSGTVFATRIWNGTVLYCLQCVGRATPFGAACFDAGGEALRLYSAGCPDLGTPFAFGFSSPGASGQAVAFLVMGISDRDWSGIPLPLPLDLFGAPGCSVYASHDLVLGGFALPANALSFAVLIPNDPLLVAAPSYWQAYTFDLPQNALGISTSNAVALVLR